MNQRYKIVLDELARCNVKEHQTNLSTCMEGGTIKSISNEAFSYNRRAII